MAFPLEIRLFGAFDVQINGSPLPPLRSRKGQWLLALMVLRNGREVERSWLAGTLWVDSSETQGFSSLRRSLTDLRQAMGDAATYLSSPTTHTLLLDLTNAFADIVEFDKNIKKGDRQSLEEAVSLYKGDLLEGCLEEWVLLERESRRQEYLNALEKMAQFAIQAGDSATAVRHLRSVISAEPLRETAQRALMEALFASGDYAAVLMTYRELRLLVRQELNSEPSAETTALFQRLRSEARSRIQNPPAATPVPPVNKPSPVPPSTGNLPRPLSKLIGRENEVEQICEKLNQFRLVTLTGSGGVGKTHLAIQVAQEYSLDASGGIWFVDMAVQTEPDQVPQTVAKTLGLRDEAGSSPLNDLIDHLQNHSTLIILDNCEHLIEACALLAKTLLENCPSLRILATSQQALDILGEAAWRVPSLTFPKSEDALPIERLQEYSAVQLFLENATNLLPHFAFTARNAPSIIQICRQLDGIPLAIKLAAARLKVLSPEQIAARLKDRFQLLTGGSRLSVSRHQTLRAAVEWSYDLLTEEERQLLCALSVFMGGWTLEAAEYVGVRCQVSGDGEQRSGIATHNSDPRPPTPDTRHRTPFLDLLTSLVDKSLVFVEVGEEETRYFMLETIRQYGAEKLEEYGWTALYQKRHQEWFLQLTEQAEAGMRSPEQVQWMERLDRDLDNLRQALHHSILPEERLSMSTSLWRFWHTRGYLEEGRRWLEEALKHAPDASPEVRVRGLNGATALAWSQGDYEVARSFMDEALPLARQKGDKRLLAQILHNMGNILIPQGKYREARSFYEESLALRHELGDIHNVIATLNNLGVVAHNMGDFELARSLYQNSLELLVKGGDVWNQTSAWIGLGNVAKSEGRYAEARSYYEQSLTVAQEMGDKDCIAGMLGNLGQLALYEGNVEEALRFQEESLLISREMGDKHGIALALESIAEVNRVEGKAELAAQIWGCMEVFRENMGSLIPACDIQEYNKAVDATREALGEEGFRIAWDKGRGMSMEQVMQLVFSQ